MARTTLNLSIDADAVERARKYSELHDTSISRLVNDFLARLPMTEGNDAAELTPTVRRLLGIAEGGPDEEDYHRYLLEKYG
ncbi:MAG TPA: DUF6364 family protein [Longimicrobium sp.]|nr:DUF6364 family protein [Longimicrobium sp.]